METTQAPEITKVEDGTSSAATGPVTVTADEHAQSVSLLQRIENFLEAEAEKLSAEAHADVVESIAALKKLWHHV